jgi:D-tagatose-1,6-bisphosphate aldolase subunit GatZ/KbaZ
MSGSENMLIQRLAENKKGNPVGVYSVCSAHKTVLQASMLQALDDNSILIIESTSYQVDQFGGYTGMRPKDFIAYVKDIAAPLNFPIEKIIFGGDHLGPNAWQAENSAEAMDKAETLVKAYVEAGCRKIHLDASMFCADDPGSRSSPLPDRIVAERVVRLCKAAEASWNINREGSKPLYIIGTEVPVPGGSKEKESTLKPTSKESVEETIRVTQKAFLDSGLAEAWERVIAVVAQGGVEFGDDTVFYYNSKNAQDLISALDSKPLVFEAHSTDYQSASCLQNMVKDHFCILKVGPALTFAYREAIFSLAAIERELIPGARQSNLENILEEVMLTSKPNYWEKYYHGAEGEKRLARKYSFSDRSRYYWTNERLAFSVQTLLANLASVSMPLSLISQFMPDLFMQISEGSIGAKPEDLIIAHIRKTLALYAQACGFMQTK